MPGINIYDQVKSGTSAVVSSAINLLKPTGGAQTMLAHITSTSSLAGVWEGTFEDIGHDGTTESNADWFPLPSLSVNTSGVTRNDPGATVTPTDDDVMAAATMGAKWCRYRRTTGSGTANWSVSNDTLAQITDSASTGTGTDVSGLLTEAEFENRVADPATAWSKHHAPAENTVATITKDAPGSGFRLIITHYEGIITADDGDPTAGSRALTIVDGDATVYRSHRIGIPSSAGGGPNGIAPSCWIPIAENKSATIAFASAAGTDTFESVAFEGHVEAV